MTTASLQHLRSIPFPLALAVLSLVTTAEAKHPTVDNIEPSSLRVTTSAGTGVLPVYVSSDWSKPRPQVTRAIIIFHGVKRNADSYFRSAKEAVQEAGIAGRGTIIIAPQFLAEEDTLPFPLDSGVLRWHRERWEGGEIATTPAPISSFDAVDAVLARLSDRSLFPALVQVVLAGHSGGGQIVQRYAVVGRGEAELTKIGVRVRYVVANPSSYVYFSEDRPLKTTGFARYTGSCTGFNRWKYGVQEAPSYVGQAAFVDMEESYIGRDVIYLLGTADTDRHDRDLDVSCKAEAEGPHRYARGKAYFTYIKLRHPDRFSQRLWEVSGVGHNQHKMLHSACGMEALFDVPGCASAKK
jgi:pimeloyl-ACP methyl ester carboxylesterase